MLKRIVIRGLTMGLTLGCILLLSCSLVQEPWIPGPNVLKAERSRSPAAQLELRHRFLAVQTDR